MEVKEFYRLLQRFRETGDAEAQKKLEPYRVKNAIILAAGLSSRFAPLSYETPKGLLTVRGEVLIERQIRQLMEQGIRDITVVVGYKRESFDYLTKKFPVSLVYNGDYRRYNNPYSLLRVLDRLDNTYICSSDNYFCENVFEPYIYKAYYSAVYLEDASAEWALETDGDMRITGVKFKQKSAWCMFGHVYFDRDFSHKFAELLKAEYKDEAVAGQVWEYLYTRHLDELDMVMRKYPTETIREFDCLEELRSFDEQYVSHSGCRILEHIAEVLHCDESSIGQIHPEGDDEFRFSVHGQTYIYKKTGEIRDGTNDC